MRVRERAKRAHLILAHAHDGRAGVRAGPPVALGSDQQANKSSVHPARVRAPVASGTTPSRMTIMLTTTMLSLCGRFWRREVVFFYFSLLHSSLSALARFSRYRDGPTAARERNGAHTRCTWAINQDRAPRRTISLCARAWLKLVAECAMRYVALNAMLLLSI